MKYIYTCPHHFVQLWLFSPGGLNMCVMEWPASLPGAVSGAGRAHAYETRTFLPLKGCLVSLQTQRRPWGPASWYLQPTLPTPTSSLKWTKESLPSASPVTRLLFATVLTELSEAQARLGLLGCSSACMVDGGVEGKPGQGTGPSWIHPKHTSSLWSPRKALGNLCRLWQMVGLCDDRFYLSSTGCSSARLHHSLGHPACQTRASPLLDIGCVMWKSLFPSWLEYGVGSLRHYPSGLASFLPSSGPLACWRLKMATRHLGRVSRHWAKSPSCDIWGRAPFWRAGSQAWRVLPSPQDPASSCPWRGWRGSHLGGMKPPK